MNKWARGGGNFGVRGTRGMGGGALGFGTGVSQPAPAAAAGTTTIRQPVVLVSSTQTIQNNHHRNMSSNSNEKRVLNEDNVFYNLKVMEYAVRGPLLLRANEIEKELQKVLYLLTYHHYH